MPEYLKTVNKMSSALAPAITILGLVVGLSFLDYFNSSADITSKIKYMNVTYDENKIREDFNKYGVKLPKSAFDNRGLSATIMPKVKRDYKSRKNVEEYLRLEKLYVTDEYVSLRRGVEYEFRERTGTKFEGGGGWTSNRGFWEVTFPDAIVGKTDTVSYHQALRIVISRRLVTVGLGIYNGGSADAKNIQVTLQAPFLVRPRSLMPDADVEFVEFHGRERLSQITNNGTNASIAIPFLEEGELALFYITTTMTNITNENIFIDFESSKSIDSTRLIKWSIGLIAGYYLFALFWFLVRRKISHKQLPA